MDNNSLEKHSENLHSLKDNTSKICFDEINNGENKPVKCVTSVFSIFFEDPFWVGILEENYDGINYMGKYIFGAEPSNSELLQFYIYEFDKIEKIRISAMKMETKKLSFKKSLNKTKKSQNNVGIGTRSQNLFQKAFEEMMNIKRNERRAEEIINKEEKYKKKLEKKIEKRRGR